MTTTDQSEMQNNTKNYVPVRYFQILILFLGMTLAFSAKVIMSIAIVAMTDPDVDNHFSWSIREQSVILSAFSWGYLLLQGVTGVFATRFGGKILVVISMGINSVVSLVLPILAKNGGWVMVCVSRLIQGLTQGVILPATYHLIGHWVPVDERSRMTNFVFGERGYFPRRLAKETRSFNGVVAISTVILKVLFWFDVFQDTANLITIVSLGGSLGIGVQLIVSGYTAGCWGWPAVFYTHGLVGVVWTTAYFLLGSDSPEDSRIISVDERTYIQSSLQRAAGQKISKTPWKSFVTSLPFISVVIANIGCNWGYWTLLTEIPTYMNRILGVNIKSNGVMSALPYISMFIMSFPIGFAFDNVLKRKWVSLTTCRKISNSLGFFGPAVALMCLTYVPPGNLAAAVLLLVIALGLKAGFYSGFNLVYLDMAPNFASTLMGISNSISNIISVFAPLAVGLILKDETNPSEWHIVFYVSAAMYIFTNTFFVVCGTSVRQSWDEVTEKE